MDPYSFSVIGCVSQDLYRLASRSSSADLDSHITDDMLESLAVMLIARTYYQADR